MKPYLKISATGSAPFRTHVSKRIGITTKMAKLVTKNANRSRKTAARMEIKRELKNYTT